MNPKLKEFLTDDFRSYNAVQVTNIILGVVVIYAWPDLNVWAVWSALIAYVVAFAVSIGIYARHKMSDSPVRVSFMVVATPLLLLAATAFRYEDWLTWAGTSLPIPLVLIILTSGFLYNWVLGAIRTRYFPLDTFRT